MTRLIPGFLAAFACASLLAGCDFGDRVVKTIDDTVHGTIDHLAKEKQ